MILTHCFLCLIASVLDVFSYVWDRSDRKGDVFDFFRQSATQWTASVHTLHMSKPVITIIVNIVYITMRINRITDFPGHFSENMPQNGRFLGVYVRPTTGRRRT